MSLWDRFRLDGRRALITGGSRGLGRAMAAALAEAGADLVLVGRDAEQLATAARELREFGHRVDTIPADVAVPVEAERMCRQALADFGPVSVLINNAGGRRIDTPTEDLPLDDWQRILDLNLTSAFICSKMIGADMVRHRAGRIINVGSIAGMVATRAIGGRTYEAAKAALVGFSRALAADWAVHNVTVNVIAPGGFWTDAVRRWTDERAGWKDTFLEMVPMRRFGEPEEIGPLAVYLASDASSYMTGACLVIDGGYTLW
jgi:gluconate 5-dehydrogenase